MCENCERLAAGAPWLVKSMGMSMAGVELPTVATDPGCDASTHRVEVMGAAQAWQMGSRFSLPALMDCGCSIVWVGEGMPPSWVAEQMKREGW